MDYIDKELINLVEVSNKINFWMVRTKKGIFFNEYVNNKYIALGWNYITKANVIVETDKFKEDICELYDCKTGTGIINKCKKFIYEMEIGDIVMVPSANNTEILFARIGDYYESNHNCTQETELISIIDSKKYKDMIMDCPYKKRRKIEIIKIVEGKRLNPNLYKALVSHHGISKINDYGIHILSSIYNFYVWKDNLNIVLNIEKKEDIGAKEFSKLIYSITDILTIKDNSKFITTKSNINSPGDLILSALNAGKDFVSSNWLPILILWGAISGIKIGPLHLNSIPEAILKFKDKQKDIELKEVQKQDKQKDIELKDIQKQKDLKDVELKEAERLEKIIEIELKKYDLEERRRLLQSAEEIRNATEQLEVDQLASSNVLNITQTDDV